MNASAEKLEEGKVALAQQLAQTKSKLDAADKEKEIKRKPESDKRQGNPATPGVGRIPEEGAGGKGEKRAEKWWTQFVIYSTSSYCFDLHTCTN